MAEDRTIVGVKAREARLRNGWTLDEVSLWTGIQPATLSRIENGERTATVPQVALLAKGLRTSSDWLLGISR